MMTVLPSKLSAKATGRNRLCPRNLALALAGLFLVFGASRGLRAADLANATARNSSAPNAIYAQMQAPRQPTAKRREEIQQKHIDNPEGQDSANLYRHSANVHAVARFFGLPTEVTSRIFEIVNFIILVIGIVWLVGRILPKTLRNRTERIQRDLQQARGTTEEANRRLAGVEERLSRLDSEIEAIRAKAEQETVLEEKRLREALEREKQGILDAATQDIAAATTNAENLLKNLAADLVIEHAKRRIAITPETDRSLVEGFLTDLSGGRPSDRVN